MAVLTANEIPVYRLSADAYRRIVATGALDGERVELLDGIMSEMPPQSPEHALVVEIVARYLAAAGRVRTQSPFEIEGADSIPEPDVLLTDEPGSGEHHPRTAHVVAEVAINSQELDRGPKARLYACAGVPVYWLVDVPAKTIEVRGNPANGHYEDVTIYRIGDTLPAPVPGLPEIAVAALLGA